MGEELANTMMRLPLPTSAHRVALAMAQRANANGEVRGSRSEISHWAEVSAKSVERALRELRRLGILTVVSGFERSKMTYRISADVTPVTPVTPATPATADLTPDLTPVTPDLTPDDASLAPVTADATPDLASNDFQAPPPPRLPSPQVSPLLLSPHTPLSTSPFPTPSPIHPTPTGARGGEGCPAESLLLQDKQNLPVQDCELFPQDENTPTGTGAERGKRRKAAGRKSNPELADEMARVWNQAVGDCPGFRQVRLIDDKTRRQAAKTLAGEPFGGDLGAWDAYCRRMTQSAFLRGDEGRDGDHANWKPSFAWAVKPATVAKMENDDYRCDEAPAQDDNDGYGPPEMHPENDPIFGRMNRIKGAMLEIALKDRNDPRIPVLVAALRQEGKRIVQEHPECAQWIGPADIAP